MLVIAMEVISGTGGNFCFTFEDMMQVLSIVLWTMEVLIMKLIVPFWCFCARFYLFFRVLFFIDRDHFVLQLLKFLTVN
ncbi:hypothetical protein OIU76_009551 [Salix suchowensis]|nr:hypothetical protein OIU76_009551 [Salix suchowensis]